MVFVHVYYLQDTMSYERENFLFKKFEKYKEECNSVSILQT